MIKIFILPVPVTQIITPLLPLLARAVKTAVTIAAAFLTVAVAALAFKLKFRFRLPPVTNLLLNTTNFLSKTTAPNFSNDLTINIIPPFTAAVLPLLIIYTAFKSAKSKFKTPATFNYSLTI